jgi:hypothetical protein
MHTAMNAIERCRSAALGGHIEECDHCGHVRVSYNSCRNRHCPKCQGLAREKWIEARKRDLLPVGYFHIVFTIPSMLNDLALRNQKEIYNLIFKAASETLLELGKDSKYLGAEIGLIGILHTWGQNLMDHPHLHCIVPAGGLSVDGQHWISTRKSFFVPVKVASRLFRGKFLAYLKQAYWAKRFNFDGQIQEFSKSSNFQRCLDDLYKKEWVVYCKPPFKSPAFVLEYLGRYTHRVAISNSRIIQVDNKSVSLHWKDYADGNKNKVMTLDASEFIRRFLMHVLPDNFVKIRYYGFLSNRNQKTKLAKCKELLGVTIEINQEPTNSTKWQDTLLKLTGIDIQKCQYCTEGKMVSKEVMFPRNDGPPDRARISA